MSAAPAFSLRSRKLWLSLLALGLAWMWWAALSKKSVLSASAGAAPRVAGASVSSANTLDIIALPSKIEREPLEASSRDPFALFLPPAPKLTAPKKAPPPPVIAAAPPAPQAVAAPSPPPLNLRSLGQATTPDGERLIYAALGDTPERA